MPLIGCATSVIIMIGLLGLIGWKVTVISSNFIALMLILNMAMNIHLTVRFLQLKKEFPKQIIGIKDSSSAQKMAAFSDGIIIGSSIVELIHKYSNNEKKMNSKLSTYISSISNVI